MPRGTRHQEIPLQGGTSNRGLVVRVDDTVRRPKSQAAAATHALLRHLDAVGFDGAPRYLGQDDQGRDILSYLHGMAATSPYPAWALTDSALSSVAELLRRYHDAVQSIDARRHTWPSSVPPQFRSNPPVVSHNDVNLDNIVFRDGKAVGLIDFDLASPGSALWDVAMAARLWVPLRDPHDVVDERAGRTHERLRLLADAYGLLERERAQLVAAARETYVWCYDIVRAGAEKGNPGFVEDWTAEAQERVERGQRWLDRNHASLAAAVCGRRRTKSIPGPSPR